MEFLEEALKDTLEKNPKKVVVAYLDDDNGVTFSYHQCSYADLQHIGQEMINEGTLRLIAYNEDRIKELQEEMEEEDDDGEREADRHGGGGEGPGDQLRAAHGLHHQGRAEGDPGSVRAGGPRSGCRPAGKAGPSREGTQEEAPQGEEKEGVIVMASAMNHKKRSHRSHRDHQVAAGQMRRHAAVLGYSAMLNHRRVPLGAGIIHRLLRGIRRLSAADRPADE